MPTTNAIKSGKYSGGAIHGRAIRSGVFPSSSISSGNVSSKGSAKIIEPSFEQQLIDMSNNNTAQTFAFNSGEAQKARDFQEYMSNTSHQREVADLKASGLNPVLSANSGAMSYSASSASGSADPSSVGALASIYQAKMNNANAKEIAKMQIKQQQKNNKNALEIAKINQATSNYAANMSSSAQRYASDNAYASSVYGSNQSYAASIYGSDQSYAASRYAASHTKSGALVDFFSGTGGNGNGTVLGKVGENIRKKYSSKIKKTSGNW